MDIFEAITNGTLTTHNLPICLTSYNNNSVLYDAATNTPIMAFVNILLTKPALYNDCDKVELFQLLLPTHISSVNHANIHNQTLLHLLTSLNGTSIVNQQLIIMYVNQFKDVLHFDKMDNLYENALYKVIHNKFPKPIIQQFIQLSTKVNNSVKHAHLMLAEMVRQSDPHDVAIITELIAKQNATHMVDTFNQNDHVGQLLLQRVTTFPEYMSVYFKWFDCIQHNATIVHKIYNGQEPNITKFFVKQAMWIVSNSTIDVFNHWTKLVNKLDISKHVTDKHGCLIQYICNCTSGNVPNWVKVKFITPIVYRIQKYTSLLNGDSLIMYCIANCTPETVNDYYELFNYLLQMYYKKHIIFTLIKTITELQQTIVDANYVKLLDVCANNKVMLKEKNSNGVTGLAFLFKHLPMQVDILHRALDTLHDDVKEITYENNMTQNTILSYVINNIAILRRKVNHSKIHSYVKLLYRLLQYAPHHQFNVKYMTAQSNVSVNIKPTNVLFTLFIHQDNEFGHVFFNTNDNIIDLFIEKTSIEMLKQYFSEIVGYLLKNAIKNINSPEMYYGKIVKLYNKIGAIDFLSSSYTPLCMDIYPQSVFDVTPFRQIFLPLKVIVSNWDEWVSKVAQTFLIQHAVKYTYDVVHTLLVTYIDCVNCFTQDTQITAHYLALPQFEPSMLCKIVEKEQNNICIPIDVVASKIVQLHKHETLSQRLMNLNDHSFLPIQIVNSTEYFVNILSHSLMKCSNMNVVTKMIQQSNTIMVNTVDMYDKLPLDYAIGQINGILSENEKVMFEMLVNKTVFDQMHKMVNRKLVKLQPQQIFEYVYHLLDSYPILPQVLKQKIESFVVNHMRNSLLYMNSLTNRSIYMLLIKHRCNMSCIKSLIDHCVDITKMNHTDNAGHKITDYIVNSSYDDATKTALMGIYNDKMKKYVELDKCPICHDTIYENIDAMHLQCRHVFHSSCFLFSLQQRPNSRDNIKCLVCMNNVHNY